MLLQQQRNIAGHVAFYNVQLPQRPGAIDWARDDARDEFVKLFIVTGWRHAKMTQVKFKIDFAIVDPVGTVEIERDGDELAV